MEKTAAAVTVAIPLIEKVATNAKIWWDNFGKEEMQEIEALRAFFRKYCLPNEQHNSPNTLFVELMDNTEQNQGLPVYFQMDLQGKVKQPVFYQKKLRTIIRAEDWNHHVSTESFLSTIIKDMIGRICNYQIERNKGLFKITEEMGIAGKGYSYDPTNLFFEEFKKWLVELSKAPFNETTLNIVESRMDYLRAIDVHKVFKQNQKSRDVTRHKTVIRLLRDLTGRIQPMITTVIASEGAREHFKKLTQNLDSLIWQSAKFCFYIFRDTPNTPEAFILDELQQASQNYVASIKETESGKLLHQLFNSPMVQLITRGMDAQDSSLLKLQYIDNKEIKWMINQEDGKNVNTGILVNFRKPLVMEKFYRLHGLIEKMYIFRKIAFDLYRFAGEGGNLLVYGYAAPQMRHVMNSYRNLLSDLESTVKSLHEEADNFRRALVDQQKGLTQDQERWLKLFVHTDDAIENLCHRRRGLLADSLMLIRKVEEKIDVVSTPEYLEKLQADLKSFTQWMVLFTGDNILTLKADAEDGDKLDNSKPTEVQSLLQLEASKRQTYPINIGNINIQLTCKKLDRDADSAFTAIEHTREECLALLLKCCEDQPFKSYFNQEIQLVFNNKKLPSTFKTQDCKEFKEYNLAIEKNDIKQSQFLLNVLCMKTQGFIVDYINYRYKELCAGVYYHPNSSGMLRALATLYKHNIYILQLDDGNQLTLLDSIENREVLHPPVYLLMRENASNERDYPYFDCMLDSKQLSNKFMRVVSILGFFETNNNLLLERAQLAFEASQDKSLSREQWQTNLRVATECMNILIDRCPKDPNYLMLRGKYIASTGDPAKRALGINDFSLALTYCKDNQALKCKTLIERGITYEYAWEIDKAIADYNGVLETAPNEIMIRLRRAKLYIEEKQDKTKGMADFEYILRTDKNNIAALKARYRAAIFLQDYELAKLDAARLKQLSPEDGEIAQMLQDAIFQSSTGKIL